MESALMDYTRAVLDSQDIGQVLQRHLTSIPDIVGADAYGIYLLDPQQGYTVNVAADGVPEGLLESYESLSRQGDPLFSAAKDHRGPVHDRMLSLNRDWPQYASMMITHGFSHAMVAPIHYKGQLVGTANFARRSSPQFQHRESELAQAAAVMVGTALGHALEYGHALAYGAAAEWVARKVSVPIVAATAQGELLVVSDAVREFAGNEDETLTQALIDVAVEAARAGETFTPIMGRTWNGIGVRALRVPGHRDFAVALLAQDNLGKPRFNALRGVLTARETEILEHAAAGLRDQEIADTLFVTIHTVKQHLKNAYAKLGARSRTDAVRLAYAAAQSAGEVRIGDL